MEFTKLIGLAAASALICMTVRKLSHDGANYIALGFFVFVAGFAVSTAAPYIEFIRELAEKSGMTDCASVILRALSSVCLRRLPQICAARQVKATSHALPKP